MHGFLGVHLISWKTNNFSPLALGKNKIPILLGTLVFLTAKHLQKPEVNKLAPMGVESMVITASVRPKEHDQITSSVPEKS